MEITREVAEKVLEVVDAGLVRGAGEPEPGKLCVEAAVCFAMGLPHGDDPQCVSRALRALKIRLNDSNWSSNEARGKGLRRLAVAQLGSRNTLDDKKFVRRVVELAIRKQVPMALRAAAKIHPDNTHKAKLLEAAAQCEKAPTKERARIAGGISRDAAAAAYADAAAAAAAAADAAADADAVLSGFAEDVVGILIDMKAPGCQWLALTDAVAA